MYIAVSLLKEVKDGKIFSEKTTLVSVYTFVVYRMCHDRFSNQALHDSRENWDTIVWLITGRVK